VKPKSIYVKHSTGRTLYCTILRADGKRLLAKGRVISEEDGQMLEAEGVNEVWVSELEEDEVAEDEAVIQIASEIGCGALDIRLAAGGRANLFTTEPCCVLVNDQLLKQINCTVSMVIATSVNFSYARSGRRVATVKSTPFAVAKPELDAMICTIEAHYCRPGPSALQLSPFCTPTQ
jgi:molybdenum cofactor cytidylyltransferase